MRKTGPFMDNTKPGSTRLLLSVLLLLLVLLFPGHPKEFVPSTWLRFPLELPVLIVALLLVSQRAGRWLSVAIVLALGLLLLLRLADLGSYLAFNRRFSPLLELHLVADGWNLASTTIGPLQATLIVLLTLIILVALAYLLYRCLLTISHAKGGSRKFVLFASILAGLVSAASLLAEKRFDFDGPAEARLVPEYVSRVSNVQRSIADQRTFVKELERDSVLDSGEPKFAALAGRDVILIFIESYGRGYLNAERFAPVAKKQLSDVEQIITAAGLHSRSGWMTSPIRGGRSWLAHATLQSGLNIDNQARFDRLVTTDRRSLSNLFQQAGWQSIGVMPAIQFAWPEGVWYSYQDLYTSTEMGYRGERFGYVTMPDQYTMAHFQNAIRAPADKPVMAMLSLLTTHAPWTPLPNTLDWDSIGNGAVYDGSQRYGEKISWKYRSLVQDMYTQSFEYTLNVLA